MKNKNFDILERYCNWIVKESPFLGWVPFQKPMWQIENVTSVLMHREGQFQTQMFIAPPDLIIPEHTHPNVDSIEIYIGGEIRFSHKGKFVNDQQDCIENSNSLFKTALLRGQTIRVKPNDIHGGIFGKQGGIFYSVQHWLNNVKPHCVAADYIGKTMGSDHLNKVTFGDAWFDNVVNLKDAASLEDAID
jgi:hypothetical protein